MEEFYTIKENISAEITEKKSKFIANLFYIESKEEAEAIIKETKKKYHDARHNCIAYRVMENESIVEKSSDDGEPSGTAGSPMLEILKNQNLCNILVIVTRYFGGILLGTGGLVRAYSDATIKGIEASTIIHKCKGYLAEIETDYKNIENFKHYCKNNNIKIVNAEYIDVVNCKIELEDNIKEKLINDIENKNINVINIKIICKKIVDKSVEK